MGDTRWLLNVSANTTGWTVFNRCLSILILCNSCIRVLFSSLTLGILKRRYLAKLGSDVLSASAKSLLKQAVEQELIEMQVHKYIFSSISFACCMCLTLKIGQTNQTKVTNKSFILPKESKSDESEAEDVQNKRKRERENDIASESENEVASKRIKSSCRVSSESGEFGC